MPLEFEGKKIRLRDWQIPDFERYLFWMRPGHLWKKFDGPYYALPPMEKLAAHVELKRRALERQALPAIRDSLVISDKARDAFIGLVNWSWESEETYWPVIGIVLYDPEYWSGGRGFEALGLWGDYLFQALPQIARLDLRTWSGNVRMMRLAEKLGYTREACFRKARIVEGEYYDGLGYGVLREEWEARYPQGFAGFLHASDH